VPLSSRDSWTSPSLTLVRRCCVCEGFCVAVVGGKGESRREKTREQREREREEKRAGII
jgi:hypothetical protein